MSTTRPRDRLLAILGAIVIASASYGAAPFNETNLKKVSRLVRQLGDEDYSAREAASRELAEIGEPALPDLQFAAASDADSEIRWRTKQTLECIAARRREAAARKDLEQFQGTWYTLSFSSGGTKTPENRNDTITCEGNRYIHMLDGQLISAGQITISDAVASPKQLEFNAIEGQCAGCCWRSIYRVEGNDLILCYNGGNPADTNRPGTFSDLIGFLRAMKREQKTRTK